MSMINDAKFEEELTCRFKIDMRSLINFNLISQKPQKIALQLTVFYQSIKWLSQKSTEELSFMKLKSDPKLEEKLTCGLENVMRNLANFYWST